MPIGSSHPRNDPPLWLAIVALPVTIPLGFWLRSVGRKRPRGVRKAIWSNEDGTTEHEFEQPVGIWEALTLASIERNEAKKR